MVFVAYARTLFRLGQPGCVNPKRLPGSRRAKFGFPRRRQTAGVHESAAIEHSNCPITKPRRVLHAASQSAAAGTVCRHLFSGACLGAPASLPARTLFTPRSALKGTRPAKSTWSAAAGVCQILKNPYAVLSSDLLWDAAMDWQGEWRERSGILSIEAACLPTPPGKPPKTGFQSIGLIKKTPAHLALQRHFRPRLNHGFHGFSRMDQNLRFSNPCHPCHPWSVPRSVAVVLAPIIRIPNAGSGDPAYRDKAVAPCRPRAPTRRMAGFSSSI